MQAREDLIERTVESLVGAKRVIIHLYNSTSPAQRRVVFGMEKPEIVPVAVRGAQWIKDRLPRLAGTHVTLPVFARELLRHGGGIREGNLRGGDGRVAADAGTAR